MGTHTSQYQFVKLQERQCRSITMSAMTEKTGMLLRNPTIRQTSASKQQSFIFDRALPTVLILSMVF